MCKSEIQKVDTKRKFVYNKSVNRYKRTYVIFLIWLPTSYRTWELLYCKENPLASLSGTFDPNIRIYSE